MKSFEPVSLDAFAARAWRRFNHFGFAARDITVPIVFAELPKACTVFPLGFSKGDGHISLIAVMGVERGCNLFVAPDGKWFGGYVPAALRSGPFALLPNDKGDFELCADTASKLVGPAGSIEWDQAFFTEQGKITPAVKDIASFLHQVHLSREVMQRACAVLHEVELLVEWPLSISTPVGLVSLGGVMKVDEKRLAALDAAALAELHASGALFAAHAQLISMHKLDVLQRLYDTRGEVSRAAHEASLGESGAPLAGDASLPGMFSFKNLKH